MTSITIVIPTLGRLDQLDQCLNSIANFSNTDTHVVVIDQNHQGFLDEMINRYSQELDIIHCVTHSKGVSKAKNYAIQFVESEYVFFLDDDAEILPDTMHQLIQTLSETQPDALFGRCVDREGNNSVARFCYDPSYLTIDDYEGKFIESTMVIKKDVISCYNFDETLGVGVFHGAEEGCDLVIRLLNEGKSIYYNPDFKVYHPHKVNSYKDSDVRRVFTYRCGFGRVCEKHSLNRKYYGRLFSVILFIPVCLFFKRNKLRYYLAELLGLLAGRVVK